MARFPRSIGDTLAAQSDLARSNRTISLGVPALAPIELPNLGPDLTEELSTLRVDLDQNNVDLGAALGQLATDLDKAEADIAAGLVGSGEISDRLDQAVDDLLAANNRLDNEILPAISDAAASPVTDDRLVAGSLTKWPFQASAIPPGALAPGSVGSGDIADFAIAVTKLKSDRHHLY